MIFFITERFQVGNSLWTLRLVVLLDKRFIRRVDNATARRQHDGGPCGRVRGPPRFQRKQGDSMPCRYTGLFPFFLAICRAV